MITAAEALQLKGAQIANSDIEDLRIVVDAVEQHIRGRMSFGGPTPLELPFRQMSKAAATILCYVMKRAQWRVNANLIAEQPRFAGGQPVPHHWVLEFQPMPEVYDAVLADIDLSPPRLVV